MIRFKCRLKDNIKADLKEMVYEVLVWVHLASVMFQCRALVDKVMEFNVFHLRALYYAKTLITNKCTKRVLSSILTHSYMFRPC
jgi:hypothetical protein